ncbi:MULTISPECIES: acetyltransferase [Gammaproteobacteria]|uniref:acetyltransferase n=1 Tax=Gammaproteobacteria TaxID=1236 RepID=UPI000DD015DB|nr:MULTISPECIES: acetyltransferase [Gammaproteobacteria]RTE86057.1 acetyltransferase [Aliidiomarina sp. B3213]TCZ91411.1 acetyltransferase [Lysobacter sp. N42]
MTKKLAIVGASGHGRVIADIAEILGNWSDILFYDDKFGSPDFNFEYKVSGTSANLIDLLKEDPSSMEVALGIGDNSTRIKFYRTFKNHDVSMPVLMHPRAVVSKKVVLGQGTVVMAGAIINPGTTVGDACIVNSCAVVEHDCQIGTGAHLSPNATLCGGVAIGEGAWIGASSVVIQCTSVGRNAVIGAGSTAIKCVEENTTLVGSPARMVKAR